MNNAFLSVREVAARLRVAPTTVYSLCQHKKISHTRIGSGRGAIRIPETALTAYLSNATISPDEHELASQ